MPGLASSDGTRPFAEQNDLAAEMHGATITSHGELTPNYSYIQKMRDEAGREQAPVMSPEEVRAVAGSTVLQLHGHLYDTGLINQVLNMIEDEGGRFSVLEQDVQANLLGQVSRLPNWAGVTSRGRTSKSRLA